MTKHPNAGDIHPVPWRIDTTNMDAEDIAHIIVFANSDLYHDLLRKLMEDPGESEETVFRAQQIISEIKKSQIALMQFERMVDYRLKNQMSVFVGKAARNKTKGDHL